jgi:hypothetical protein
LFRSDPQDFWLQPTSALFELGQEYIDAQNVGGKLGLNSSVDALKASRLADAAVGLEQFFAALLSCVVQAGRYMHVMVPLEPTYLATWDASPEELRVAVEMGVVPEPGAE